MSDDRLFPLDSVPEVPLFRPPAPRKGARGGWQDERLSHDYPPEWDRCSTCGGSGWDSPHVPPGEVFDRRQMVAVGEALDGTTGARWLMPTVTGCPDCLGMGSLKARVRLEAGHRCVRCKHPGMPKVDAAMLGVEPSGMHDCETCDGDGKLRVVESVDRVTSVDVIPGGFGINATGEVRDEKCPSCKGAGKVWTPWSACDEQCVHQGPIRVKWPVGEPAVAVTLPPAWTVQRYIERYGAAEAEWRILTVHHLDGDKANVRWWNLAALCQRCHLEIQAKVVMERVWPHEHSPWFRPFVAGYYAFVYEGREIEREEADERMDELLAYERVSL